MHLFGNACDIDAVQAFARKPHLVIVWDAAQAHGAAYRGKDVGSFGDFAAYSGFAVTVIWSSKHLGMILSSDAATNDENCLFPFGEDLI